MQSMEGSSSPGVASGPMPGVRGASEITVDKIDFDEQYASTGDHKTALPRRPSNRRQGYGADLFDFRAAGFRPCGQVSDRFRAARGGPAARSAVHEGWVSPFCYVVLRGPKARFLGLGFSVATLEDLNRLAAYADASSVEDVVWPGGGKRVRMTDPAGFQVDAIWGQSVAEVLPHRAAIKTNSPDQIVRARQHATSALYAAGHHEAGSRAPRGP